MRMAVAREETLQAQHVAMFGVTDDDRAADAAFEQPHTAQDQRPHDAFAEIGLFDHQIAQPPRRHDQRFDGQ